jgi:hypothetical protein
MSHHVIRPVTRLEAGYSPPHPSLPPRQSSVRSLLSDVHCNAASPIIHSRHSIPFCKHLHRMDVMRMMEYANTRP